MLSREAISGMFAKRKAPGGEPTDAPSKKKKKATAAGSSRQAAGRVAEPVIGLEAASVPTDRPEPAVEEGGEAIESGSPVRVAAQPSSAPSPGRSVSTSTGRRPEARARGRAGEAAFRTTREGTVRIGRGESVVGNPALARRLLEMTIAPRDEADLGSRTTEEVLMSSFAGLVLAAHNIFSLEKVYEDSRELARGWSDRVAIAEADRDAARESVRAMEDREKGLRDEIARLKADGARLDREAQLARRKLAEVQSDLETTRTALGSSEAAAGTAQAESYIHQLEAQSAREEARQAAKEAEAAKERATRAVETYKASAAHTSDMVAASRLFYITGFADCKKEIGEAFPNLDLSAILEPVFVEEGQESEAATETESGEDATEEAPATNPTGPAPTETEMADLTGGSAAGDAPTVVEPSAEAEPTPTALDLGLGTPESPIV